MYSAEVVRADAEEVDFADGMRSSITTAAGTSTIIPTGIPTAVGDAGMLRSSPTTFSSIRAWRNSTIVVISGNITRMSPWTAARKIVAKLRAEQIQSFAVTNECFARPRNGLCSLFDQRSMSHLVGAQVQRPDHDRTAIHFSHDLAVGLVVILFTRLVVAGQSTRIRCGTNRFRRHPFQAGGGLRGGIRCSRSAGSARRRRFGRQILSSASRAVSDSTLLQA